MKINKSIQGFLLISILAAGIAPVSFAQEVSGGVDVPGTWYPGMGVNAGDYFSYKLCHVNLEECKEFQMDFWFEGDKQVGTEDKWLVQAVVYDGNKIIKGTMELGKIAPEPTGGSEALGPYRGAFKTSIVWLSAFSTADDPRAFKQVSWGKIANIGGQQVRPTAVESVSTPAGTFETVLITWYTGGKVSKIWVEPGFPFPVKASTWTQVSSGIPPQEYRFELLDYKQGISNPFTKIVSTEEEKLAAGCPKTYDYETVRKTTKNFEYLIEAKYGPKNPKTGCDIEWLIEFKNKFNENEYLNQVQYDIWVVDDNQKRTRSIADEEGRLFLFSASGQVKKSTTIKTAVGTAHYVIWVYGLSPINTVPPPDKQDYLQIDIPISSNSAQTSTPTTPTQKIPEWIKTNAGWWASGQIDDNSFVQGIQYLIKEGIMKIPSTTQGTGTGSNQIPSWIKTNAGWWASGQIDDNSFVQGIQYLIKEGIIKIST